MGNNFANGRTLRERLLSRLIIDWDSGCWNWAGYRAPLGRLRRSCRACNRIQNQRYRARKSAAA